MRHRIVRESPSPADALLSGFQSRISYRRIDPLCSRRYAGSVHLLLQSRPVVTIVTLVRDADTDGPECST